MVSTFRTVARDESIPSSRRRRRYGFFFGLTNQKVQTEMLTRMRASRLARGFTLKDIAKALWLSESCIGRLEHARQKPRPIVTECLARFFDLGQLLDFARKRRIDPLHAVRSRPRERGIRHSRSCPTREFVAANASRFVGRT